MRRVKKVSSRKRDSARAANPIPKTPVPKTIDEYLAAVPEPARTTLSKLREMIRRVAPPETTEAITYRIPTFKYKGSLVAFAAFANHCSLFPMNGSLIKAFESDLKDYETSKGTIRFPVDKPLPAALIKKIVAARVADRDTTKRRWA
jgi:uncharacterized protein YdhG (YjbR/CyaY superfamily)